MPFDTFPIPAGSNKPDLAELHRRLVRQGEMLGQVIVDMNNTLWDRIAAQEQLLETVQTSLRQSIARRNGATLKKLKTVVQPIYQSLNERLASQEALLNTVPVPETPIGPVSTPGSQWRVLFKCNDTGGLVPGSIDAYYCSDGTDGTGPLASPGWIIWKDYGDDSVQAHSDAVNPVVIDAASKTCAEHGAIVCTTTHSVATPTTTSTQATVSVSPSPSPTPTPVESPIPFPATEAPQIPPAGRIESQPPAAPVIPDEGTVQTATDFQCSIALDWISPIAPPGSPEWCRWADSMLKGFSQIFDQVNQWEQSLLDPDNIDRLLSDYRPMGSITFPPGYAIDAVVSLIKRLATGGRPILKLAKEILDCLRQMVNKMFARCDPRALTVLLLIRALIESLKRTRLGTDALAWVTVDVVIPLRPLEETIERLMDYVCPQEAPSVPEAIEAWLHGYIDDDLLHCIQRIHGQDVASFAPYVKARGEFISPKEAINYVRRSNGTTEDEKAWLRKLGFIDDEQTAAFQELYWEIPTIGDHLEWLRKNVFDDAYVRDFRLMEGFDERFWPKFGKDLTTLGMRKDNAALHYAAHWINPSFSQQFNMVQRLRPGRVDPSLQFTKDDLLRTMQEMDVGPYFRERLERVSHPVINLTLLMKLYGLRAVSDEDFLERLQDLGYTPEDAEVQRTGLKLDIARMRANSGRGWTPTILARLFALGLVSDDFVSTKMGLLGYSDTETADLLERAPLEVQARTVQRAVTRSLSSIINTAISAFRCGATSRDQFTDSLVAIGVKEDTAKVWADSIDASVQVDLCKQQVAAIRSAVLKGKITIDGARQKLLDSGMPDLRASQYVSSWSIQLDARSPTATASQLLRWVSEGLLDSDTAKQRLENLGWKEADVAIALAESRGKLAVRQARSEAAKARDERTQAKTLAQLMLDNQEETDRLKMSLKKVETPSRLQKWLYLGVIDVGYFRDRMRDLGYGWELIDKYQAEIDAKLAADERKKAAANAKRQANQPGIGPVPGNGQQPPG